MVRRERRSSARIVSEWGGHLTPEQFLSSRLTAVRWTHPDGTAIIVRHQFKDIDGPYAVVLAELNAIVPYNEFLPALAYAKVFDRQEIDAQLKLVPSLNEGQ